MSREPKPLADSAYWYKGQIILLSGLPTCLEGGIPAMSAAHALEKVKKMSTLWQCKEIKVVYIYELDHGGEVPRDPEIIWYNGKQPTYVKGSPINLNNAPKQQIIPWKDSVHNHQPKPTEPTVTEQYESAHWTTLQEHDVYPTVTMKE